MAVQRITRDGHTYRYCGTPEEAAEYVRTLTTHPDPDNCGEDDDS